MGSPPLYEQVPPLEENTYVDHTPTNHPTMIEKEMRDILSQMSQAMTPQGQSAMFQAQAMTTLANWDVCPRIYQKTMSSQFWGLTLMNPPIFYGSKVD